MKLKTLQNVFAGCVVNIYTAVNDAEELVSNSHGGKYENLLILVYLYVSGII